ncbi:MAG TPA: hypothetical protein VGE27_01130, partial [Gemmatimonas sp.]|uniref:hypothetical protein n=1 Tax=Gemmatimonas sp. TaxID=1962908 RepID=UPI002EDA0A57
FAARNPRLGTRERRRAALIAATIGQSILARRARAVAAEKKALFDDLRRILIAYLEPMLDAPSSAPLVEIAGASPAKPAERRSTKAPSKSVSRSVSKSTK